MMATERCSESVATTGERCKNRTMHGRLTCRPHAGPRPPLRKLPAAPLVAAVEARGITLARAPERAARAFFRAQRAGNLTIHAAEKLAHELLAEHPASVWGDEWWATT